MTAAIDPTGTTDTTPAVPAWLNLAAVCSPELRDEIHTIRSEGERLGEELIEWARSARAVIIEAERAISAAVNGYDPDDFDGYAYADGMSELLEHTLGVLGLHAVARIMGAALEMIDGAEEG